MNDPLLPLIPPSRLQELRIENFVAMGIAQASVHLFIVRVPSALPNIIPHDAETKTYQICSHTCKCKGCSVMYSYYHYWNLML